MSHDVTVCLVTLHHYSDFLLPLTLSLSPSSSSSSSSSSDIKEHVKQIEKAVSGKEPRFVLRALRALPSTSRRLNANVLHKALAGFYTNNTTARDYLLGCLEEVRVWRHQGLGCREALQPVSHRAQRHQGFLRMFSSLPHPMRFTGPEF